MLFNLIIVYVYYKNLLNYLLGSSMFLTLPAADIDRDILTDYAVSFPSALYGRVSPTFIRKVSPRFIIFTI